MINPLKWFRPSRLELQQLVDGLRVKIDEEYEKWQGAERRLHEERKARAAEREEHAAEMATKQEELLHLVVDKEIAQQLAQGRGQSLANLQDIVHKQTERIKELEAKIETHLKETDTLKEQADQAGMRAGDFAAALTKAEARIVELGTTKEAELEQVQALTNNLLDRVHSAYEEVRKAQAALQAAETTAAGREEQIATLKGVLAQARAPIGEQIPFAFEPGVEPLDLMLHEGQHFVNTDTLAAAYGRDAYSIVVKMHKLLEAGKAEGPLHPDPNFSIKVKYPECLLLTEAQSLVWDELTRKSPQAVQASKALKAAWYSLKPKEVPVVNTDEANGLRSMLGVKTRENEGLKVAYRILEIQRKADQQDAEKYRAMAPRPGWLDMDQVACNFAMTKPALYAKLREIGVLKKRANAPTEKYLHDFCPLNVNHDTSNGVILVPKLHASPAGFDKLVTLIGKPQAPSQ